MIIRIKTTREPFHTYKYLYILLLFSFLKKHNNLYSSRNEITNSFKMKVENKKSDGVKIMTMLLLMMMMMVL